MDSLLQPSEEWRSFDSSFPNYEVSNFGQVRIRLKRQWEIDRNGGQYRLIKQRFRRTNYGYDKYLVVEIGKRYLVHRIVALTFVEGRTEERWQVDHRDGDRKNNKADNLRWVTPQENIIASFERNPNRFKGAGNNKSKLTDEAVREIREKCVTNDTINRKELAKKFGVGVATITYALHTGWTHIAGKPRVIRQRPNNLRITDETVAAIKSEYRPGVRGFGLSILAKRFGVSMSQVANIVHGRQRTLALAA